MIARAQLDGVLTLRMAHGKANALDVELLEALVSELGGITADVRALVLTGSGSIFSAGVDLFRLTREGPEYVHRFLPLLSEFLQALFTLPIPVVAAVNGHAIAGGCLIALASDLRVMADGGGKIGVPELLVGVPFPVAALEIVRYAFPKERLQSLILTGRTMSARDALGMGLVDEVIAADEVMTRAQELARQLAQIPAPAYALTKRSLRAETVERIEKTANLHDPVVTEIWSAPQTHERIREYLRRTVGK